MILAYSKFYTWATPLIKKYIKYKIQLPLPDGLIVEYKQQIAYGISYIYLISSVSVLAGVRQMAWLIIIVHIILSGINDNPLMAQSTNDWDIKLRDLLFDACVLGGLIMASGIKVYK